VPSTPPTTNTEELTSETFAERRRLAGLLAGLTPEQWAQRSLCDGWRVREVVAHITLPYRHNGLRVIAGIIAARGRFNVFADRIARRDTANVTDAELLASLQRNAEHRWKPPGGGQLGALSHDVIHGLDITEPLGLPRPPTERVRTVVAGCTKRQLAYFGVDLAGTRLQADDCDVSVGPEDAVTTLRMPAADILLVITGRRVLPNAVG
jgi:uncharacterized protein (TIGR03083 family)